MADNVVLTERAFRELRRMYRDQQREMTNLKRSIAPLLNRHQAIAIPPKKVKVKNDSGADRLRGEVLEFTSLDDRDRTEDGRIWLVGDTPDLSNVGWGILDKNIPSGKRGPCVVSGECIAKVNVTSTSHTHADLASGNNVLQSGTSGPVVILSHNEVAEEQLCPVVIDRGGDRWLVKADANVASGESGTFSIYTGTFPSETDSGENLTAGNRTGLQIDSGTWAKVTTINGQKYAEPWECPA